MASAAYAIDVLLATYCGEKYLEEQIESLFEQTCTNFRVISRDDGSNDHTHAILDRYHQKYGDRFVVIDGQPPTGSAKGNFTRLTQLSDAAYTMYCDQDDYWHPEKIEKTLAVMRKAEAGDPSKPTLVHGDLRVVDVDRNVISRSFWSYQGLNPALTTTNRLIVQNNITGCAVMINKALRIKAQPFPESITMHDWWLGLIASVCGQIIAMDEALIDYRQHGANDTGAKNYSLGYIIKQMKSIFTADPLAKFISSIARSKVQAQALLDALGNEIGASERRTIETYVNLDKLGAFARRAFVLRNGFLKQGLARNIAYLISL